MSFEELIENIDSPFEVDDMRKAYEAGQRDMRELCEDACDEVVIMFIDGREKTEAATECLSAIRAIKVGGE